MNRERSEQDMSKTENVSHPLTNEEHPPTQIKIEEPPPTQLKIEEPPPIQIRREEYPQPEQIITEHQKDKIFNKRLCKLK